VRDGRGRSVYEIAGRWNSRLIARAVGAGSGFLHPDADIGGSGGRVSPPSPSAQQEYILLWQNSEKPPAPFNLTPFAITLNDCPKDTLRPYLPHTDCRNRPDQRAFELGQYELANDLKMRQEDKQRARRKERETGQRPLHSPRWFTAVTDADTGERLWEPSRTEDGELEYWVERAKVWQAKQVSGGDASVALWKDVEDIFIDEPKELAALL
jgi:oxysterol-binding protein 1